MLNFLAQLLASSLGVFLTAQWLGGVQLNTPLDAVIVALVFGVVNATIGPVIRLLTLPLSLLSLGLFSLLINAALVLLVDSMLRGFWVRDLWTAFLFSIVCTLITMILGALLKPKES